MSGTPGQQEEEQRRKDPEKPVCLCIRRASLLLDLTSMLILSPPSLPPLR